MTKEEKYTLIEEVRDYEWGVLIFMLMIFLFSWFLIIGVMVHVSQQLNQPLNLFGFEYGFPIGMAYFFLSFIMVWFASYYQSDKTNYKIIQVKKEIYLKKEK